MAGLEGIHSKTASTSMICLPMQNSPPNTNITMIEANDEDANGNARIVYTFPNFAATSGPFQISRTTGLVTVRSDGAEGLDRERQDFYEVSNYY